ncbi:MAG: Lecithin:cholesterol acyltransferase [Parcubacteria group bacterium Gr01-1014_56]|nr:MAG: Lecithin:cholesterol acyltransferase [Parcubacteria group bacterium Gr01-1014_56]
MRRTATILFCALCFLLSGSVASANTTVLSNDPSYALAPFSFYCQPYKYSFENNKHYVPTDGPCAFSMPSTIGSQKIIAVYQGAVGNATLLAGDGVFNTATLVQEDLVAFGAPVQDQDYFAVVWDYDLFGGSTGALGQALATGTALPVDAVLGQNYFILPWKWGTKPPSEYEPVVIIPGILGSWEKNGEWVVDPILHTYDNLIDTFLANGYVENQTLFRFGYNWEEPNEVSAHMLANKIQQIKQTCACSHVDIVAHSMGGLVALYYIENSEYQNDVGQLFLVATPLSGAPKAYKTWEGGEVDFGEPIPNAFMQTKFWLEARGSGYASVFDYIRNRPIESIHELLPVYNNYLSTATTTLQYPTGYPINGFLETIIAKLNQVYGKVRVNTILADTLLNTTISGFLIEPSTELPKWEHGKIVGTFFSAGDGTVPRTSIENIIGVADKEFDGVNHLQVVATSSSYIFENLNNNGPTTIINKTYRVVTSFLYFKLFSPIDMQIVAPDGKRLGKDFSTNTEINEIPDAFYSGFSTGNEYAVIVNPIPGNYSLQTIGTGSGGAYTIITGYGDSATTTQAEITSSTTPAQVINHTLAFSSTSTVLTLTKETPPPPPPVALTPDSCIGDMTKAYKNKWITKKAVYEGLVFDCKALRDLFKTRDSIEKVPLANRTKAQKALLSATYEGIKRVLAHMDLLAKDKTNTQDAVLLIHSYTTWFRDHELHQ